MKREKRRDEGLRERERRGKEERWRRGEQAKKSHTVMMIEEKRTRGRKDEGRD